MDVAVVEVCVDAFVESRCVLDSRRPIISDFQRWGASARPKF